MKMGCLLLLVFLTLSVVAYNYQFRNIPSYMFLNAYNLAQERVTEFRMTLPSNGTPHEYRDVTEDGGFRAWVIDYVIACDVIRTGMKIEEYDLPYDWLKGASNSSKGYDMTIKFFDDFYFLQVRYYPEFYRTRLEHTVLWTINIVTAIAWILFFIDLLLGHKRSYPPQKGGEQKRELSQSQLLWRSCYRPSPK